MRGNGRKRRNVAVSKSRIEVEMPGRIRSVALAVLLMTPIIVLSRNAGRAPDTMGEQLLNSKRLEALAAPIALYPDPLVAQVLMA